MKIGQVKDSLASAMFLVAMILVATRPIQKNVLLGALGLGFLVDLIFTLRPTWHCQDWDRSNFVPKLVILAQLIVFGSLAIING
jgi:hypothetical protein